MIAAVSLAGGEASRLGGIDKPLLEIAGLSLLARILRTLAPEHAAIAISANGDPARFSEFGCPVLNDGAFTRMGPLAGILAGLEWAETIGATDLLSVPGDTPFIPGQLARALSPAPAYAANQGRAHPAVALWPVTCREALKDHLSRENSRSVLGFAQTIGARRVEFATGGTNPFANINTPADLAAVSAAGNTA